MIHASFDSVLEADSGDIFIFLNEIVTNSEGKRKKDINLGIFIKYCIFHIKYNTTAVGFSNFRSHYGLKLCEW